MDSDEQHLYICNSTANETPKTNYCVSSPYNPLMHSNYAVLINGFLSPVLILITIVTNLLVCLVLARKNMRSPTNSVLIAMAVSDTLTGICPLPCFLYFYTAGRYDRSVPYDWCFVFICLADFLPTIFHTASVWLTVALAVQRYLRICHSFAGTAGHWCTCRDTVKFIVAIYVAALLPQLSRFFESR